MFRPTQSGSTNQTSSFFEAASHRYTRGVYPDVGELVTNARNVKLKEPVREVFERFHHLAAGPGGIIDLSPAEAVADELEKQLLG